MNYTTIALIVNLLFVLILVAGFLVGLWRGLKKSAVNMAFAFAAVLLAFFITIPVTNAILNISVGGGPLKDTLLNAIFSQESIKNLIQSVPSLETLIAGIPAALGSTIVFILLTIIAEAVFYVIYKIIALIFLRNKKVVKEEDQPEANEKAPKKYRLWGAAVGLVKTFVVLVFAFMPLTALTGLFGTLTQENDYFIEQPQTVAAAETTEEQPKTGNILTQNMPQVALDGLNAFNNSAFGIFGGVFGLDNAVFDYYANVDINGQKVYIRQEIETYWKVVDLYTSLSNANGRSLKEIDFEKVDPVIKGVLESGLYKTVVTDLLTEVITNYDEIDLLPAETVEQFKDVLDAIALDLQDEQVKADYFTHDINKIYDMFKSLATSGLVDDINALESQEITDILDLFSQEKNKQAFTTCLNDLFTTNIVRAAAKPVVKLALGDLIDEIDHIAAETKEWTDAEWTAVSNNLVDAIDYGQKLMKEVDLTEVLSNPLTLLQKKSDNSYYDLAAIFENLGGLVDTLRANKLFVNHEGEPIVDTMLKGNFELPKTTVIGADGEEIHFENANLEKPYTQLFTKVFSKPMTKIQQSGLYELIQDKSNVDQVELFKLVANQGETFLLDVILPLTQVEPTKTELVDNLLKNMDNPQINFNALDSYADWENDLTQVGKLVVALNDINVGDQNGIEALFAGDMQDFLLNLTHGDEVEKTNGNYLSNGDLTTLIDPMLHAKSTKGFTDDIFNIIGEALTQLTNSTEDPITINVTDEMLNGTDNQTQEICDILENFLPVYTLYTGGTTALEDLQAKPLGMLFNALRNNAYRDGEEGAFKIVFTKLKDYLEGIINEKLQSVLQGAEFHFGENDAAIKNLDFVSVLNEYLPLLQNLSSLPR